MTGPAKVDSVDDLVAFGAPLEVIAQTQEDENSKTFEVFEENWETVQFFLRLSTQWIVSDGAFIGLNYNSLDLVLKLFKVKNRAEIFDRIQIMEFSALELLNKRSTNGGR